MDSKNVIDELLQNARQCLLKMRLEDGDELFAIDTWANAAQAYASVARAMMLREMTTTGTGYNGEPLRVLMTSALR